MRKILIPVISLVCVILVAIAFGISAQTVATRVNGSNFGNYYQLVFERGSNVFALVSFICLVVGAALLVVCLIPTKFRKFVLPADAIALLASGIFVLLAPSKAAEKITATGTLTATAVLLIVAGALVCGLTVLAFLGKKESK